MPITFIDNYPKNNLEKTIIKNDGTPLEGEMWVYKQFLDFNENDFLPNETWFLKHNYNLSTHPSSKGKVEGQIDFILLTKYGLLVIEVKGGGLRVDEYDCYYSYNKTGEYETQNPFTQAKEYVHSLKNLNEKSNVFVYRSIILPHEAGFELKGNQLSGYKDIFYSKKDYVNCNSDYAKNKLFFEFINELGKKTRKHNIRELNPNWDNQRINDSLFTFYPELSSKELRRIKSELFPTQSSYGYNPDKINTEIILNENYETLKGLRRNNNVMVQGAPGTGKTILAQKFLAENLLKQHKGIVFCANKLIRAKLEHIILNEYNLDPNFIQFKIFSELLKPENLSNEIDFIVFDEAQEYFDKGLYDFISEVNKKLENPKILILYDPEQSIISGYKELAWYTDFFIDCGYTHYYFDENYRCIQHKKISEVSELILSNRFSKIFTDYSESIIYCNGAESKIAEVKKIIFESRFNSIEKIILVQSQILDEFKEIAVDYFKKELEELTEENINIPSQKIRYTTPLKYRGLENKCVYIITNNLNEKNKIQNYVAVTRAMELIRFILWK